MLRDYYLKGGYLLPYAVLILGTLKSNPTAMTLVNVKKAIGSMSKETTA